MRGNSDCQHHDFFKIELVLLRYISEESFRRLLFSLSHVA